MYFSVLTAKWKYSDNKRDSPDSKRSLMKGILEKIKYFIGNNLSLWEINNKSWDVLFGGVRNWAQLSMFWEAESGLGCSFTKCRYWSFSSLLRYFTRVQIAPHTSCQTTHFKSIISPPWGTAEEICLTRNKEEHLMSSKHLQLWSQIFW